MYTRDMNKDHEWVEVQFSYATWIECKCTFKPNSQQDMDSHIPRTEES